MIPMMSKIFSIEVFRRTLNSPNAYGDAIPSFESLGITESAIYPDSHYEDRTQSGISDKEYIQGILYHDFDLKVGDEITSGTDRFRILNIAKYFNNLQYRAVKI